MGNDLGVTSIADAAGGASRNQTAYEEKDIVNIYATKEELQKPEKRILDDFAGQWSRMSFLDIGVGGGRTTCYFAPLVRSYMGVDYSAGMIAACKNRFQNAPAAWGFNVSDARRMTCVGNQSMDFALFSFNGIDYVSHQDRLEILKEVHRVLRRGGFFFFSSHNLAYARHNLRLMRLGNLLRPHRLVRSIRKARKLRILNPEYHNMIRKAYAVINDGAHESRLCTYYINPDEQIAQLHRAGFGEIQALGVDGSDMNVSSSRVEHSAWVHYLCKRIG